MELSPRLDEPSLARRQIPRDQFDRVESKDPHGVLVVRVEVRAMMRAPDLDEHANRLRSGMSLRQGSRSPQLCATESASRGRGCQAQFRAPCAPRDPGAPAWIADAVSERAVRAAGVVEPRAVAQLWKKSVARARNGAA